MARRAGLRIEAYGRVGSTQQLMRERLLAGENVDKLVIRALAQDEGRGRRGSKWASDSGGSYQTLAVKDEGPAPTLLRPGIALFVSVGIAKAFARRGMDVRVKWPNDLYLSGRKVGGVLCEYVRGHLLIGVGVNVANEVPPFAARIEAWRVEEVNSLVLEGIAQGLQLIEQGEPLGRALADVDALAGVDVAVTARQQRLVGTACGVDDEGRLLLKDSSGTTAVAQGDDVEPLELLP